MLERRLGAQWLAGPGGRSPEAVVGRILAVQAQDHRAMLLAIRPRSRGLVASDVDRALGDRSMIVTWLNRGTLHLVSSADYPWLHALTAPRNVRANARRLGEEGVSPAQAERGAEVIVAALAEEGPLGRNDLRERLDRAGVPTAGQALVHLIGLVGLRGQVVRGPVVDGRQRFVLVEDWLGPQPAVDPEAAIAELTRRYLAGHGPAGPEDLAKWAGITLGQARAGFEAIARELRDRGDGLAELATATDRPALPPPRLLGAFDPVLHGWRSREWLIPDDRDRGVVTTNGIFRPTILLDGRVVGTWGMAKGRVELNPFGRLPDEAEEALGAEAEAVLAYRAG